ncbi:uncharacterized protein beat-Ic isoform X2 [Bactrocera oleae]|uniref:uncharacterized protein beat-Ic isoform X2 n=1 Tax=Bactrocera oleae TaxID=104688 RepID=UPI00387E301C
MPARLLTTGTHKAQHNKALNWHKDRASGMWTYCVSKPSAIYACETWLRWCLVLTCLLIIPDFIAGLKDVSVTIPQAVKRGSNAQLICNYDMENDTLYSIKWYKGRREFYRYTPKENPAMKVFTMAAGLNVEVPLHHIKTYQIERYEENNLESVVSALHFMVTTQHFIKGQMRLKCTASIFDIFKEEIESVIEEDRPRIMASGRSYDMHNNYPYEQHASGDGFEDHNESFLTYSAADITSSATTVHGTAASVYVKALKMHLKRLWTGLVAAAATIRATNSQRSESAVELKLKLEHRYDKRISEASDDEKGSAPAAAVKNFSRLKISTDTAYVAYIFIAICTSVFLCALTRHFISCQRSQRKSRVVTTPRTTVSTVAAPVADFTATVLPSKVIIMATTTARRVVNDGAASILAVKRTLKERKSFHNCVGKNLKSLSVRLAGFPRALCLMFMQWAKVAANPLQKLANQQQQQQQQKSASILRNQARTQRNTTQQLSLTVAGRSPSTPLPATVAALTFDTPGVSAAMHAAIAVCNNTNTNNDAYNRGSRGDGSGNQAIANFTKDTSKDQTLLMMIAQRFDCQHVDDFVTLAHSSLSKRQEQQQQQQQEQQRLPLLLYAIKSGKVLSKVKALLANWQASCVAPRPCWNHC